MGLVLQASPTDSASSSAHKPHEGISGGRSAERASNRTDMDLAYSQALYGLQSNPCPLGTIPPLNRLETRNWDLVAAIGGMARGSSLARLRRALQELTGREHVFFAPSGRSAIAQILSLLPHREVVMPALTCHAVRHAAESAGKRIIYVDINPTCLNATAAEFAPEAKSGRVLLPTHLFGIPTDIEAICELARARDCVTIEDAAGAFVGRHNGGLLGTFADFGVVSFERSKRIPAFRGAAIIVNNNRGQYINPQMLDSHRLVPTRSVMPGQELARSLAYNFATTPWFYGRVILPRTVRNYMSMPPGAGVGPPEDVGRMADYCREFHPYQAELVLRMLRRLSRIQRQIEDLVAIYQDKLQGRGIKTFLPRHCDAGGLLRFPVAFPGKDRTEVLRSALKRGTFLETNFDSPLPDRTQLEGFPNSVWAAENLVLLPLYARMPTSVARSLASRVIEIGHSTGTLDSGSVLTRYRAPEE